MQHSCEKYACPLFETSYEKLDFLNIGYFTIPIRQEQIGLNTRGIFTFIHFVWLQQNLNDNE